MGVGGSIYLGYGGGAGGFGGPAEWLALGSGDLAGAIGCFRALFVRGWTALERLLSRVPCESSDSLWWSGDDDGLVLGCDPNSSPPQPSPPRMTYL